MKLFNQNNYPNVPYNYPGGSGSTIKSSGCGVCCMCTVLSAFGIDTTVEAMAKFSEEMGARVDRKSVV